MTEDLRLEQIRNALEAGTPEVARRLADEQLRQCPNDAESWFLSGVALERSGRLLAARRAWLRAVRIDPRHLQVHFALSHVCLGLGLKEEALAFCEKALALAPTNPQAMTHLGIAREALGQTEAALAAYDDALRPEPGFAAALQNRSALLGTLGRRDEARSAWRSFCEHHPSNALAWRGLGEACLLCDDPDGALIAFQKLLSLASPPGPPFVSALLGAGTAQALLERFDAGQALFDEATRCSPDAVRQFRRRIYASEYAPGTSLDARAIFLLHQYERLERCDWKTREHFLQVFDRLVRTADPPLHDRALGFRAMAVGLASETQLALARQIADGFAACTPIDRPPRSQELPLNIGYVSTDFRNHASSLLIHRLLPMHRRDRFRVHAYAIGPATMDSMRKSIQQGADVFTDLSALDDDAAARRIADDGIDILIDLAGYTDYCRPGLFARRPAPWQIGWMGYGATTGSPWIDHILTDDVVTPPGTEACFSEALLRLPVSTMLCSYANDEVLVATRESAGLPENAIVLAALHAGYKIDPAVFTVWMQLLHRHPRAILWLLDGQAEMAACLRSSAVQAGISASRLIFAPRLEHSRHLARLACADLFLDTTQRNGATTICDAIVAGVPTLTCTGNTFIQRVGASILHFAGFPQGITSSLEEYSKRALEWLENPARLPELRNELKAARQTSVFYDLHHWVDQYEELLLSVWNTRR